MLGLKITLIHCAFIFSKPVDFSMSYSRRRTLPLPQSPVLSATAKAGGVSCVICHGRHVEKRTGITVHFRPVEKKKEEKKMLAYMACRQKMNRG